MLNRSRQDGVSGPIGGPVFSSPCTYPFSIPDFQQSKPTTKTEIAPRSLFRESPSDSPISSEKRAFSRSCDPRGVEAVGKPFPKTQFLI
jgi:hypothetical protein